MISRAIAKLILLLTARTRILHRERSALNGPAVLAANHISHFDPPILSAASMRKIDWMAMAELFEHPLAARYFRAIDTFSTDRGRPDRASVRTALDRLKRGRVVGIFPEGGLRSGPESVLNGARVKPGFASIAEMTGTPVLPCVILGTDRYYDVKRWLPLRRNAVWIAFGEPLRAPANISKHEARTWLETECVKSMRELYAELRERFSLKEDDLPQTAQHRKGRDAHA